MPFDATELRKVMGLFATGVTVITTRDQQGRPYGLTANAVTSLSLVPPLLLICVDRKAETFPHFFDSKIFVLNILAEDQAELSRRFATTGGDKFTGVRFRLGRLGTPFSRAPSGTSSAASSRPWRAETTSCTWGRSRKRRREGGGRSFSSGASTASSLTRPEGAAGGRFLLTPPRLGEVEGGYLSQPQRTLEDHYMPFRRAAYLIPAGFALLFLAVGAFAYTSSSAGVTVAPAHRHLPAARRVEAGVAPGADGYCAARELPAMSPTTNHGR